MVSTLRFNERTTPADASDSYKITTETAVGLKTVVIV